ncbi:hypothetical protein CISG_07773 [Coccidioides immitis RMSCC 3703]|uniref:Uncharacterized protein n=1 Tax=Coccidioides immitis RMSCC 3703 TaxID=454286 RepID=A0A0J8R2J2_COCIT|nr:hypothetical protein CISG_07773 [Coccidioides immitis RMSCC 3703]
MGHGADHRGEQGEQYEIAWSQASDPKASIQLARMSSRVLFSIQLSSVVASHSSIRSSGTLARNALYQRIARSRCLHLHGCYQGPPRLKAEPLFGPMKSIFGFLAGEEIEISKIVVETVVSSAPPGTVDRHQEEKQFLLQRLRRPNGELSQYHPRRRLLAALHGFYRYATIAMNDLNTISTRYKSLPDNQKRLIELTVKYDEKIRQTERLIKKNDVIAQKIVDHALEFYGVEFSELQKFVHDVSRVGSLPSV